MPATRTQLCTGGTDDIKHLKKLCFLLGILLTLCTAALADSALEDEAFANCTDLTSVIIPAGTTSIGEKAFYNCTSLTHITIPEGVTTISKSAFEGCTALQSVTCPAA